jgi:hypothetical protein
MDMGWRAAIFALCSSRNRIGVLARSDDSAGNLDEEIRRRNWLAGYRG